jgi:D-alanyl-D-alanine carboxypeptidase
MFQPTAAARWIAIAALCASINTALAQEPTPLTLEQCIANEAKSRNFSGVVSIARPSGNIAVEHGWMAGPGSAPMRTDAQFNIGSAGKMWAAVAVAQLMDAGKIALHDPVGQHVNGLTPEASAVTIRQLLTHNSGLGNFFTPEHMALFKRANSLSEPERLKQHRPIKDETAP